MFRLRFFFLACLLAAPARPAEPEGAWLSFTWNGERALRSVSQGRQAVVSLVRGRLMHFGPADSDVNLLLAPASRDNPNRLGGHRLWLGPQAEWPNGWPPPAAWEYREPAAVAHDKGVLRLTMPATDDVWPQLTRTYHWNGASLVCGAEFSGGSRPAQLVQILQVPPDTAISVATAHPEDGFPAGYVLLPSTSGPFAAKFTEPPHASRSGDAVTLKHTGAVVKVGFRPQTLAGRFRGFELQVRRGAQEGEIVSEPDQGFHTQVYLSGNHEAFAELEQLSPLFAPGKARFEMVLTAVKR